MKWYVWDLIAREPLECLYVLINPDFGRRMNAILAEAIERWLEGLA